MEYNSGNFVIKKPINNSGPDKNCLNCVYIAESFTIILREPSFDFSFHKPPESLSNLEIKV